MSRGRRLLIGNWIHWAEDFIGRNRVGCVQPSIRECNILASWRLALCELELYFGKEGLVLGIELVASNLIGYAFVLNLNTGYFRVCWVE